jgi:hypothetical protein
MQDKWQPGPPAAQFEPLQLFRFPFTFVNIGITVLFLIFLSGAAYMLRIPSGGIVMISVPGLYLTAILYTHYMFIIVEYTSLGFQVLPKISGAMVQPTYDQRLIKGVVVVVVLLYGYHQINNETIESMYICFVLLVFPLTTAVITIERVFFRALNPLVWWQMAKEIGLSRHALTYLIIQVGAMVLISDFLSRIHEIHQGYFIPYIFSILIVLMWMFRSLGILLHDRANELGILVSYSKEKDIADQESYEGRRIEDFVRTLHDLSSSNRYKEARQLLEERLEQDNYLTEAFYFNRLQKLQDPHLAKKMGQNYIEKLISNDEQHEAWRVFDFCTSAPGFEFRLLSGQSVLSLADSADSITRFAAITKQLLKFESDFPGHPGTADALLLAARNYCNHLNDFDKARVIIGSLESRFPQMQQNKKYQATRALLENL